MHSHTQTSLPLECFERMSGLSIVSPVALNPAWPVSTTGDAQALAQLASSLSASLAIDRDSIQRLFELWNTAIEIQADEIGDWAWAARCTLHTVDGTPPPEVVGLCATVYATGEVSVALNLEGLDASLWLQQQIDLNLINGTAAAPG